MIASIRGRVMSAGAGWVVVEVGGVGMRVEVPSGRVSQAAPGEDVALHTSLIVREDSLTLFGFATPEELEVFGHLIAVSGVGPRSALGVLSALTPGQIVRAVAAEDEKPFKQVSGIGPKTAKLIAVSLAGKIQTLSFAEEAVEPEAPADPGDGVAESVQIGLVGLGWAESEAAQAVRDAREAGAPSDQGGLLRAALALLQSGRPGARGAAAGRSAKR
ncbi:Holliday junction branch migration protein RuvA [Leucobacter sp. CSA1]|uniref:Holliday junction branch migration complex subunit RuvA n=1 Tax=Leucobacter chromiisoli TaxID=2796471 RepID=A0A934Q5V1_9MICO|nr:Holliday junction branch migration protein RuvA [Leucobacter chromiisoli]MBK0418181.1 Holliday junction branch migration protein RuvA [Leucobacter chromiisoli]